MLRGACSSSLNFDLYFTDLYRPYNMKDRVKRPLTAMILHLFEDLTGDPLDFAIFLISCQEMCAGSILHR